MKAHFTVSYCIYFKCTILSSLNLGPKKLFGCPPQLFSERVGGRVFFPSHPPEYHDANTSTVSCMSILLHGPLGRSAASAFTTSPATFKSKQPITSCSDCDILNVLRVERRHVDPLFTCTANPTFCSLGAAMIGMSTARNFI